MEGEDILNGDTGGGDETGAFFAQLSDDENDRMEGVEEAEEVKEKKIKKVKITGTGKKRFVLNERVLVEKNGLGTMLRHFKVCINQLPFGIIMFRMQIIRRPKTASTTTWIYSCLE